MHTHVYCLTQKAVFGEVCDSGQQGQITVPELEQSSNLNTFENVAHHYLHQNKLDYLLWRTVPQFSLCSSLVSPQFSRITVHPLSGNHMIRQRFLLVVLVTLSILVSTALLWFSSLSSLSSSSPSDYDNVSDVEVNKSMESMEQLVSTTATTILAPSNSSHTKTPKVNNNQDADDNAQMPQLDASEIVVNSSWVVMTMAMMDSSTADADVAAVDELNNTISLLKDWHFVIVVLSNQKDQNDPSVKKASSIIRERLFNMTSSSSNSTARAPNRRVHILDDVRQERLGYGIAKHLPSDSYARKNIGYLYAIHRGAKHIWTWMLV